MHYYGALLHLKHLLGALSYPGVNFGIWLKAFLSLHRSERLKNGLPLREKADYKMSSWRLFSE